MTAPSFLIGVTMVVVVIVGATVVGMVSFGGARSDLADVGATRSYPPNPEPTYADPTYPTPTYADPTYAYPTEEPTPTATVPDGYRTVSAPAGLTLSIPAGWPVKPGAVASNVQADDPGTDCLIRFGGETADPRALSDVVAGLEKTTPSIRRDYRRVQLSPVSYGAAGEAVQWEFTFRSGTGPRHAFGLYWRIYDTDYVVYGSCSTGAWPRLGEVLTTMADTAAPH
jgi:hypothetical protein